MQLEMATVMSDLLPRMMQGPAPPNAPNATAMAAAIAKMGIMIGLAFTVVFSLVKLTYYAIGCFYLRRPAVGHWFNGANAQSPPQSPAPDGGHLAMGRSPTID